MKLSSEPRKRGLLFASNRQQWQMDAILDFSGLASSTFE
jgi:hypothetical protein